MNATVRDLARAMVNAHLDELTLDHLLDIPGGDEGPSGRQWDQLVAAALAASKGYAELAGDVRRLYFDLDQPGDDQRLNALHAVATSNAAAGFALGLELGRRLGGAR